MEILTSVDMPPADGTETCTPDEKICTFSIDMV
jgi:hypothetical protein